MHFRSLYLFTLFFLSPSAFVYRRRPILWSANISRMASKDFIDHGKCDIVFHSCHRTSLVVPIHQYWAVFRPLDLANADFCSVAPVQHHQLAPGVGSIFWLQSSEETPSFQSSRFVMKATGLPFGHQALRLLQACRERLSLRAPRPFHPSLRQVLLKKITLTRILTPKTTQLNTTISVLLKSETKRISDPESGPRKR